MKPNRATPRHIILQFTKVKDKERILNAAREKVTYKGIPIKLPVDFSAETSQARREWHVIFMLKGKTCNLGYSSQQDYHLEQKERERIPQTSKN